MEAVHLAGRVLFAAVLTMMAMNHFMQVGMMKPYAASKGVPAPGLAVVGSGLVLLAGALSVGFGFYPTYGVIALTVFFLPVTFMMHDFWNAEEEAQMNEMIQFMKNLVILGASWVFLAIPQPWPLSLG